jgi:type IV pilus assembly protein PilF
MNSIRISILFAVSLFILSGCATSHPKDQEPASKSDQVRNLMDIVAADITENDATGALQILAKVQDMDDSLPEEYYFYALAYLQKRETRLAIESARRAIRMNPKFSAAKNTLGNILMDQGKYEEAEKYLLESANDLLFRDTYLPKTNLGILYYKKGDLVRSESWLSKAIQDGGAVVCLAYYYRGKVRTDKKELLLAERDFIQSAKGSCSGMSENHIAFGKTLIQEKKYDQARAKFIEIQRLFPSSDAADQATQYLREIP